MTEKSLILGCKNTLLKKCFKRSTLFFSETTEDELLTLEDVLFNEADYQDNQEDKGFTLALRLSPEPFNLVKGYEFKMLNK